MHRLRDSVKDVSVEMELRLRDKDEDYEKDFATKYSMYSRLKKEVNELGKEIANEDKEKIKKKSLDVINVAHYIFKESAE